MQPVATPPAAAAAPLQPLVSPYVYNAWTTPVEKLPETVDVAFVRDCVNGFDHNFANTCLEYIYKEDPTDYLFCFPVEYLSVPGYSEADLQRWLEVIALPGTLNFSFRYYGTLALNNLVSAGVQKYEQYALRFNPVPPTQVGFAKNEFYVVGFEGRRRTDFERYLAVILLRYIWCHHYIDIPYTVFRFLDHTPANRKQAILLAHLRRTYFHYFGLVAQGFAPFRYGQDSEENHVLDPFKRWTKTLLKNLNLDFEANESMVQTLSDALSTTKVDLTHVRSLFAREDYLGIYQYCQQKLVTHE